MNSRSVKSLFVISLLLLLGASFCWYMAPPAASLEGEAGLKVGPRETWMIVVGLSSVLGLAAGLAGVKVWLNDRSEKQLGQSLLN